MLLANQTIFYKAWFQKGIYIPCIGSFRGKVLTFPEFIQKYDAECNFLNYMQVVSAIPKHPLDKTKEKQVDKRAFLAENVYRIPP